MSEFVDFDKLTSRMVRRHELSRRDQKKLRQVQRLVPLPAKEKQRLLILRQADLIDSSAEELGFNRIIQIVHRIYMTAVVAITFIDIDRAIFAAKIGLTVDDYPRDFCLCSFAVLDNVKSYFSLLDAKADQRFCHFPAVASPQGVRFYASAPIVCCGHKIGALCIADPSPRTSFDHVDAAKLMAVAELVSSLIEERRARVLEQEKVLAELVVAVTYRIREPLRAAILGKESLRELVRAFTQSYASPTRNKVCSLDSLKWSLARLIQNLQRLQEEVEISLQTSLVYFSPSGFKCNPALRPFLPDPQKSPDVTNAVLRESWTSDKLIDFLMRSTRRKYAESGLQLEWSDDDTLRAYEVSVNLHNLALALDVALTLQRHMLGRERIHVHCSLSTLRALKDKGPVVGAKLFVSLRSMASEPRQSTQTISSDSASSHPAPGSAAADFTVMEKRTIVKSAQMLCRSFLGISRGSLMVNDEDDDSMVLWVPCLCFPYGSTSPVPAHLEEERVDEKGQIGDDEKDEDDDEDDEDDGEGEGEQDNGMGNADHFAGMLSEENAELWLVPEASPDETVVFPHSPSGSYPSTPFASTDVGSSSEGTPTDQLASCSSPSLSVSTPTVASASSLGAQRSRGLQSKFGVDPSSASYTSAKSMQSPLSHSSPQGSSSESRRCMPDEPEFNHSRVTSFLATFLRPFWGSSGGGFGNSVAPI